MENTKSREIPVTDLFHNLQLEWISYYIRSQIYSRKVDVKTFNDILRMKKDKIDTFSLRNSIASIFTKQERMNKFLEEFYPKETNLPNFQYTPKNLKWLSQWDTIYFYHYSTVVEYEGKDVTILKNDNLNNEVEFLTPQRQLLRVPYCEVRRDITLLFD